MPNKPIKYLINTHHHFDHASGIRTYAAEGITIVTHEINRPYYERTAANLDAGAGSSEPNQKRSRCFKRWATTWC